MGFRGQARQSALAVSQRKGNNQDERQVRHGQGVEPSHLQVVLHRNPEAREDDDDGERAGVEVVDEAREEDDWERDVEGRGRGSRGWQVPSSRGSTGA